MGKDTRRYTHTNVLSVQPQLRLPDGSGSRYCCDELSVFIKFGIQ